MTKPLPKQRPLSPQQQFLVDAVMFESGRKIRDIERNLEGMVKTRVKKEMEEYEEQRAEMHKNMRLLILKTHVISELRFATSGKKIQEKILSIAVQAFDEPDEWWFGNEHVSIAGWYQLFIDLDWRIRNRRKHSA